MWLRILRQLTILFSLAHHRFSTHFGDDHCRMSSVHSVVEAPARKRGLILTVLFNLPIEYREYVKRFGWAILFIALIGAMYLRE